MTQTYKRIILNPAKLGLTKFSSNCIGLIFAQGHVTNYHIMQTRHEEDIKEFTVSKLKGMRI